MGFTFLVKWDQWTLVYPIIGLNAVVVEKRFVEKKGSEIKDGKTEMTLFEFKGDKISRIFEYW